MPTLTNGFCANYADTFNRFGFTLTKEDRELRAETPSQPAGLSVSPENDDGVDVSKSAGLPVCAENNDGVDVSQIQPETSSTEVTQSTQSRQSASVESTSITLSSVSLTSGISSVLTQY